MVSAFLGVALGMLPYISAARVIVALLSGNRELSAYMPWLWIGLVGYAARTLLYNLALSRSHNAK